MEMRSALRLYNYKQHMAGLEGRGNCTVEMWKPRPAGTLWANQTTNYVFQ